MLKLHIVQADFGDCFLLEYGDNDSPRYLLIDGGPANVYDQHLKPQLESIDQSGRRLDLVMVSHVDTDHITGVLDLMVDVLQQRTTGDHETIEIDGLWHNSFSETVDVNSIIVPRLRATLSNSQTGMMPQSELAVNGIGEGNQLRLRAAQLNIASNNETGGEPISTENPSTEFKFGNLTLQIVGPTKKNLQELEQEWLDWLEAHETDISLGDPAIMANADKSIPNLSSIMVLAKADGHTILFTGDGRSDHLLDGLKETEQLDPQGNLHVDVLKLMHHGSNRNVTKTFFKRVTADTYVISANGNPDNPDFDTLSWIVEAAKSQNRNAKLIFTNETPSVSKLRNELVESSYGYKLEVMDSGASIKTLTLAP